MISFRPMSILALAAGAMGASETMGPAAFMWPPDRVWSAAADNTAPCGSVASVSNRTAFPNSGGKLAITAQDDSYNSQLSISFLNDPKTQADFTPITTSLIPEIDPGHTCISLPDNLSSTGATITPGTNATIQIKYTADFDRPENQTFYACADITFVTSEGYNFADIPCFNATDPNDVPAPTATGSPTNVPGHGESGPPLSTHTTVTEIVEGGSGGLSKGAIAGAVVGSVVGLALIVGLGLLWYRERARKERLVRERDAGRTVKWVDGATPTASRARESASVGEGESIRMGNLPTQA